MHGEDVLAFYGSINITPRLTGFKHLFTLSHVLCSLGRAYLGPIFRAYHKITVKVFAGSVVSSESSVEEDSASKHNHMVAGNIQSLAQF